LKRDPRDVIFAYGRYGKPSIDDRSINCPVKFNLSHSRDAAMLAVTCNLEVGIDIEHIQQDFKFDEIMTHFFSPREVMILRSIPCHDRRDAFFACWTRKEAYIKARGEGLAIPLGNFDVAFAPGHRPALLRVENNQHECQAWNMHELLTLPEYKAALVVQRAEYHIRYRDFGWAADQTNHSGPFHSIRPGRGSPFSG
jgi:4'-phosphopantetheinyl transferase